MKKVCPPIRSTLLLLAFLSFCYTAKSQHCKVLVQVIPNFCIPSFPCLTLNAVPYGFNSTPPYTYLWSTGETTETICVPNAFGNYSVSVTDINGCVAIANLFIPAPITAYAWLNQTCFNCCPGDPMDLGIVWTFNEPPGFTYLWSTGETTPGILTTVPGTYTLTITDPTTGCTLVLSDVLAYPPAPDPTILGPMTLCAGQTVTLSVSGGPYNGYQWLPGGEYTPTIEVSGPGTYVVIVSQNGFNCAGIDTLIIQPGSGNIPPPQLSGPAILCSGQSGIISVINQNEYTGFDWNTGASTADISISNPGTYTVTVTNAGGCTSSASITVDPGSSNLNITGITSSETSCTNPNGSIDISVNPPGPYSYDWSNGSGTQDITNLSSGSYTVTVTDQGGCTSSSSYIVTSNILLPTTSTNITASSCGQNNGAIDLSVSPAGTYTFLWSTSANTEDLSNIFSGTYSVTVTSVSNGCTATASVTVPNNNSVINITGNSTPLTSCTSSNGAIDITPAPSGIYTFVWSSGETTEDLTNLSAGNYTVTVSSSAGCTAIATYSVVNNTTSPVLLATPSPATCGQSNGAIDLNVTPTGTYTYVWSNGSITEDLISIPAGNYSVTVTSTDGCTSITSITVPDNIIPLTITGTTSPNTSCINQNGAIDISVNPPGTYTYAWSNGASTEDLNNIPAGVYNVTVTFGLTCINTQLFEVLNTNTPIAFTGITAPNTSCSQPNGAIDITITTPGSFTYLWSNGEITEDLQNLTGGTYSLTVTGSNGCTSTAIFDIINTNSNFSFIGSVLPNTSCILPNGSIDLTLTPSGSYSFIWSTGASSEDLQNLSAGNYSVTVSDINNCALVESYSIQDILSYPVISSQVTPSTCGNSNGAIDISIIPANGNSYSWSNGSTTEDQLNLLTGDYIVTVTGINGCITIDTIVVGNQNSNFTLAAMTLPNSSCINANGSIDLSITPSGTYTYAWNNGAITQDLQGIAAGSFIVTVTDILNCISSDTFLVADNISIPILFANITSANCGANNGGIDLTVNPTANNTFLWSNGSVAEDLPNIFPGSYSVIVTDTTNGCQVLDTFNVQNINNNFSISGSTVSNTSCTSQTGSIDLTIAPAGTYTFIWSNGFTSEDLSALNPGSYTVTVTDNASCSSSAVFIGDNNTPIITISASVIPSTCGSNNGAIDLTINPSVGNSFLWSNGAITEDLQNIVSGTYMVTVTSVNGCSASTMVLVQNTNSNFSISAST
ncbi:MAG: hypothetical protein WBB31_00700, partial [Saprospiraceae bacterium]